MPQRQPQKPPNSDSESDEGKDAGSEEGSGSGSDGSGSEDGTGSEEGTGSGEDDSETKSEEIPTKSGKACGDSFGAPNFKRLTFLFLFRIVSVTSIVPFLKFFRWLLSMSYQLKALLINKKNQNKKKFRKNSTLNLSKDM